MANKVDPPDYSFLLELKDKGHVVDCFTQNSAQRLELETLIFSFYKCLAFSFEKFALRCIGKNCSDPQLRAIVTGTEQSFAAWTVAQRNETQILLRDFMGVTHSWLYVADEGDTSKIYFGTAITLNGRPMNSHASLPLWIKLLVPLHELYSRALLWSALRRAASYEGAGNGAGK